MSRRDLFDALGNPLHAYQDCVLLNAGQDESWYYDKASNSLKSYPIYWVGLTAEIEGQEQPSSETLYFDTKEQAELGFRQLHAWLGFKKGR